MSEFGVPTMTDAELSDWETKLRDDELFDRHHTGTRTVELYHYIADYVAVHDYGPTLREMAAAMGLKGLNTAHHHLPRLREFGLVTWTPGAARTVRVTGRVGVIAFDVVGVPVTQGSARGFVVNGRAVVTHDKRKALLDWRNSIAFAAQAVGGEKAERGVPVWVRATFRLQRPASAPKRIIRPATKPDVDKLARALLDAGTGILWTDDSQVVSLQVSKRFAEPGEPLGVYVEVRSEE